MIDKKHITKDVINIILQKHKLGELSVVTQLTGGFANPAFLVNNTYVIRFNAGDENADKIGFYDRFLREAVLFPLFQEHGILTPHFVALDNDRDISPYFYIINKFLPGEILTEKYKTLDDTSKKNVAFNIGVELKKVHDISQIEVDNKTGIFSWCLPWKESIIKEFDEDYVSFNNHNNTLTDSDRKHVEETYALFKNVITNEDIPLKLIHHDFHANHIVLTSSKNIGFIDFEWACFGDPLWDFQKLPINLSISEQFDIASFLKGYGIHSISKNEQIRFKFYCFLQAIWQIDYTRFGKAGYPEEATAQGYNLISNTEPLISVLNKTNPAF